MSDADCRYLRVAAASCAAFVRGVPLFFHPRPRTPLRVFGIIALDILHVLRYGRRLPRARVEALAMFLDFEGCANAVWDRKGVCRYEYRLIRHRLEEAGLGPRIEEYLDKLRDLECRRPPAGGDRIRFDEVRLYRERVARLSFATAAAIALESGARQDADEETLFRILMQCQIIDDVIDFRKDAEAGLPSFLTASASLPLALGLTAEAARDYGAPSPRRAAGSVFPFRIALHMFTALSKLVVRVVPGGVKVGG